MNGVSVTVSEEQLASVCMQVWLIADCVDQIKTVCGETHLKMFLFNGFHLIAHLMTEKGFYY